MGWVVSDLDYEGMICEYELKTAQQVVKMVFFVDLTSLPPRMGQCWHLLLMVPCGDGI
jgi:hypothetical protein